MMLVWLTLLSLHLIKHESPWLTDYIILKHIVKADEQRHRQVNTDDTQKVRGSKNETKHHAVEGVTVAAQKI